MSYFWDTFWTVRKMSENSAPVLAYEAGASVRARKSLKMRTNRQTDKHTQVSWKCWIWTSKRLRRNDNKHGQSGDLGIFLINIENISNRLRPPSHIELLLTKVIEIATV